MNSLGPSNKDILQFTRKLLTSGTGLYPYCTGQGTVHTV